MIKVVAAILKRNDTYFLARRASNKVHHGKWEFPGGKIEQGENPESALERELLEEFGILTKTGDHVLTTRFNYDSFQIELLAYETVFIAGSFNLKDHDKIVWVSLQDMRHYDLTGADIAIRKSLLGEL